MFKISKTKGSLPFYTKEIRPAEARILPENSLILQMGEDIVVEKFDSTEIYQIYLTEEGLLVFARFYAWWQNDLCKKANNEAFFEEIL